MLLQAGQDQALPPLHRNNRPLCRIDVSSIPHGADTIETHLPESGLGFEPGTSLKHPRTPKT